MQNAARIKAALELGLRLTFEAEAVRSTIHNPADAAVLLLHEMSAFEQEHLRVILLDSRNRVMDIVEFYHGSLKSAQVRVAELFKPAIQRMAAGIILIHNHPSSDPTPSPDDVAITRVVVQVGRLLDIEVMDHLVISRGRFMYLKERGLGFDRIISYLGSGYGSYQTWNSLHEGEEEDLIYAYSHAQALADGVLVDVCQMAKEAGFKFPAAITSDLYARLTSEEREQAQGQSYKGRLWDVLWMASLAARKSRTDRISFKVLLAETNGSNHLNPHHIRLRCVTGPGNEGEPVITLGFPEDF